MIDPHRYGVSFSIKQCRNFGLDSKAALAWLTKTLGFRRFRLISYWDEIETQPGKYDFQELDRQITAIKKAGGIISLCLGARQPRWPENHWPDWAWQLPKEERTKRLLAFVEAAVERYKNNPAVISWQLENEALLKNFGEHSEVDRNRLKNEYRLVKQLDPTRPVIMTTSTSWGIPFRQPIPDSVGFSMYNIVFNKGTYRQSLYYPPVFRLRGLLIRLLHRKPAFIHELQAEPWGPKAIWEMPAAEQAKSMNPLQLQKNINYAKRTKLYPIDLWGGEWWYWKKLQGDSTLWQTVQTILATDIIRNSP